MPVPSGFLLHCASGIFSTFWLEGQGSLSVPPESTGLPLPKTLHQDRAVLGGPGRVQGVGGRLWGTISPGGGSFRAELEVNLGL